MGQMNKLPPVLTIDEVAAYLRLPKETVERQAADGQIPGRCIEATWRFLKTAIDEWLQSQDSRTVLLQQAGAFADDESLPDLRKAIYRKRGRSETERKTAA
ncbi:MAG: helix-turn-helix domain-containing protein [Candidatus Binatia bacterium]